MSKEKLDDAIGEVFFRIGYNYLTLRNTSLSGFNKILIRIVGKIGKAYKDEIPGRNSTLRKGERTIINMLAREKIKVRKKEIKTLYRSYYKTAIGGGRGTQYLKIPYNTCAILIAIAKIIQDTPHIKRFCISYCEKCKALQDKETRLYRRILADEHLHELELHYSRELLNDDQKAKKLYEEVLNFNKNIHD